MSSTTYVHILKDTLKKKLQVLEQIIEISKLQEKHLQGVELEFEDFDELIEKKQRLLDKLEELDTGFEKVYERVKGEMITNKHLYKQDITELQDMIRLITEKSVLIQSIEKMNKLGLDQMLSKKKIEIKEYKMNASRASNYYKNMSNAYQGESYFLDKKK